MKELLRDAALSQQDEPELGHYFSDEPNDHARSRPLYAAPIAQTAPQVPERLPVEPYQTVDRSSTNYKAGWNACRKAMLEGQTAPQPEQSAEAFVVGFKPGMSEVTLKVEGGRLPTWMDMGFPVVVLCATPNPTKEE